MSKLNKIRNTANVVNTDFISDMNNTSLEQMIRFPFDRVMFKQNLSKVHFSESNIKRFKLIVLINLVDHLNLTNIRLCFDFIYSVLVENEMSYLIYVYNLDRRGRTGKNERATPALFLALLELSNIELR